MRSALQINSYVCLKGQVVSLQHGESDSNKVKSSRFRSAKLNTSIRPYRPRWVPRDFPCESIGISEVAGI